jgi:uncharacterized membrane protein
MNHLTHAAAVVAALVGAMLAGCGSDLPEVDCNAGAIPTYGEVDIFSNGKCNLCHSTTVTGAGRNNAPSDVNVNTYEAAVAHATQSVEQVYTGAMPPAGFEAIAPTAPEKQELYLWGLCGTPP